LRHIAAIEKKIAARHQRFANPTQSFSVIRQIVAIEAYAAKEQGAGVAMGEDVD